MKKIDKLGRPTVPDTPTRAKFWLQSREFLNAALAAHNVMRDPTNMNSISIALTFLYFRSLELSFKACLPHDMLTDEASRRTFGHKLSPMIDTLDKSGVITRLNMTRIDFKVIEEYSEDYSSKWFEYGPGFTEIPTDLEGLADVVTRFVNNSKDYIKRMVDN